MNEQRMVLNETAAIECIAFLLASARGLEYEPKDYGPMRLAAAAGLLSRNIAPRLSNDWRTIVEKLVLDLPEYQRERERDPNKFFSFLDKYCRELTEILMHVESSIEG